MKLDYIRVSRDKQTTALQEDAMKQERCERTFTDKNLFEVRLRSWRKCARSLRHAQTVN